MTLSMNVVRKMVKEKKTKFATVTFIKKDGSERKINGLFRPTSKMVGNEKGKQTSAMLERNGLIPIYSLKDRGWRCFSENMVLDFK